jgi:peroxin-7
LLSIVEANWSPAIPRTFGSASGDCTVKLWDSAVPTSAVQTLRAHEFEVLSFDWNKYDDNQLVTASVDKSLRLWDIRRPDHFITGELLLLFSTLMDC